MTRFESRGLLVAGFVTGWFSYRHLKFNRQATPEEKAIIEKQEEKTWTKITIWLLQREYEVACGISPFFY